MHALRRSREKRANRVLTGASVLDRQAITHETFAQLAKTKEAVSKRLSEWQSTQYPNSESGDFPSSPRRGGRDINKISRSLLYGADGVVIKFHRILWSLNTTRLRELRMLR